MDFYLGVDGGGTSCRAALADATGRIRGRGNGGAANIMTDPDKALASIVEASRAAVADAGCDPAQTFSIPAVLGLAGANIDTFAERISSRLPFRHFLLQTDSSVALRGALGSHDGAVAILGTGSVFLSKRGEHTVQIGGWGFTVGDQGSGARIGRRALEETLLANDHVVPASALTTTLLSEFESDPDRIVEFGNVAIPADFARLAPRVFEFASGADPTARRIIEAEARMVSASIDAVMWPECSRLCLLGGLAPFYPPFLTDRYRRILVEPLGSALDGAVALSVERFVGERLHERS